MKFLHDAFVLAEVVGHLGVDQVRLAAPADRWPDGYVRVGNKDHNVEVTSAHGGRKLGAEYKNVTKPELVPGIAVPIGKIARDLDAAIQAKVDKHYGSRSWLVVYLNILPDQRFAVRYPRWEPCAGIPPARILAGGGR